MAYIKADIANALHSLTGQLGMGDEIIHNPNAIHEPDSSTSVSWEIEQLKVNGNTADIIDASTYPIKLPELTFDVSIGEYTVNVGTESKNSIESLLFKCHNDAESGYSGYYLITINTPNGDFSQEKCFGTYRTVDNREALFLEHDGVFYEMFASDGQVDNTTIFAHKLLHLVANEELTAYKTEVNNKLSSIDSSIVSLKAEDSSIAGRIAQINSNINNIQSQITNIDSSIGDIQSQITNIDSSISDINSSISDLDSSIVDLKDYVVTMDSSIINFISTKDTQIYEALENKADLDEGGKVPASQLPSYVDDVVTIIYSKTGGGITTTYPHATLSDNKLILTTGNADNIHTIKVEEGKIYVDVSTNKTYRWNGLRNTDTYCYAEADSNTGIIANMTCIGSDLALGHTSSTAFPGDEGATNSMNISVLMNRVAFLEQSPALTHSLSPSTIFAGEPQNVRITLTLTTKDNLNATILGYSESAISEASEATYKENNVRTKYWDSSKNWGDPGTTTLYGAADYNISGITGTLLKNAALTKVRPVYYTFCKEEFFNQISYFRSYEIEGSPVTKGTIQQAVNPKSQYKLTSSDSSCYFYICVPYEKNTLDENHFVMGGAPVAMSKIQAGTSYSSGDVTDKATYTIYRTDSNNYASGTTLDIKAE